MSLEFFGQTGEDYLIWKALGEKPNGFYVDVGAADGKKFSNSYFFYKQGWRGICIEPNKESFERLIEKRKEDTCIRCAIGSQRSDGITFYSKGLNSSINIDGYIEQRKLSGRSTGLEKNDYEETVVPMDTLNNILESNSISKIDFISIDVEGYESEVLRGFNLSKYKPSLLVIEEGFEEESKSKEIRDILFESNYKKVCKIKNNFFYAQDQVIIDRLNEFKSNNDRFKYRKRFKGTKKKEKND